MKAQEFIDVWKSFSATIVENNESFSELWKEPKVWTQRVLGPSHDNDSKSRLGKSVKDTFENLRYRPEEWKVDLVMAKEQHNWPIPKVWKKWPEKWAEFFWPITYEVLIEHEDSCSISYEEMAKLIHLRAPLKVLITYTHEAGHEQSEGLIKETQEQFEAMLKAAWNSFPENPETEYLLIIGQLEGEGDQSKVNWFYTIYSANGDIPPVEAPQP